MEEQTIPTTPRRIHIVGGAGSGKTTLARQLSDRLRLPFFELDVVGYENGSGGKRPLEEREDDLRAILARPGWITEGAFVWWIDPLLREADLVVWLDLHWTTLYRRVVLRHVKADLAGNNRHPGFLRMLRFAKSVYPYHHDPAPTVRGGPHSDSFSRAATALVLTPYEAKVLRCRRPSDVKRLLRRLDGSGR